MYKRFLYVSLFLCFVSTCLMVQPALGQDRDATVIQKERGEVLQRSSSTRSIINTGIVADTLRNFELTEFFFLWGAAEEDDSGWTHGTNLFEDIAKGTKLRVPDSMMRYTVSEVLVTFVFKAASVTNEPYEIRLYTVDGMTGGPGELITSQVYSMADLDLDDDLETPAILQSHIFDAPVEVPEEFFAVVYFGEYGSDAYQNLGIGASDLLGRFVEEDWELHSNNEWFNMSTTWFENADDGWYMWIEALVEPVVGTSNDDETALPRQGYLRHYPNPFRTTVAIEYGLTTTSTVSIEIYDLLGRRIATLIDEQSQPAGAHSIRWDGTNDSGQSVVNGVYMYTLKTGGRQLSQTMVVLR